MRLLNSYEQISYDKLLKAADRVGASVFPKVRLADVIPVNNSGISDSAFSYALKSHVDFVVTDEDQDIQFVIEFDGPSHLAEEQRRRDALKNKLLERFDISYARINARYLDNRFRGLDLLTYFIECWFLMKAFHAAQDDGTVPPEEDFDATFILTDGTYNKKWPYWLSFDVQAKIRDLHKSSQIITNIPNHWIGVDSQGNYRCLMWMQIDSDGYASIQTGMKAHQFQAIDGSDLLQQLAIFDLYDLIVFALSNRSTLKCHDDVYTQLDFYQKSYKPRSMGGSGPKQ
jgi:hypothetical protein